jgi:hypothetical protein
MTNLQHVYEIRPRKDRRGVDLISGRVAIRPLLVLFVWHTTVSTRVLMVPVISPSPLRA